MKDKRKEGATVKDAEQGENWCGVGTMICMGPDAEDRRRLSAVSFAGLARQLSFEVIVKMAELQIFDAHSRRAIV